MSLHLDIVIAGDGTVTGRIIPPPPPATVAPRQLPPATLRLNKLEENSRPTKDAIALKKTQRDGKRAYPKPRPQDVLRFCEGTEHNICGSAFTAAKPNASPNARTKNGQKRLCRRCAKTRKTMLTTERQRRYRARLAQQAR